MADIKAFLTQKKGPFPLWVYAVGAFGITYWYLSKSKAAAAGGGTAGGTGQFNSTQSTKYIDPKTGAEINTSYSASGSGYGGAYGSPAQFVTAAGPMPYSGGDIYVNYPGQTTAPTPPRPPHHPPPPPPKPQPSPPRDPDWGHWATVRPGDTVQSLTQQQLGDPNLWTKVWNDPVNKILYDARGGDPSKIQPGDVIWIFNGWKPGWIAPPDFVPYPMVKPPPPEPFSQGAGQWYTSPTGAPQYLTQGTGSPNSQQTWQFTPVQTPAQNQAA